VLKYFGQLEGLNVDLVEWYRFLYYEELQQEQYHNLQDLDCGDIEIRLGHPTSTNLASS
jgi:hypothetical protein